MWNTDQLRKECTSRKFRMNRKTPNAERVQRLKEFDSLHRTLVDAALESVAESPGSAACTIRLLTILFSDQFAVRFAQTGDKLTRQQLDAGEKQSSTSFWREVTSEFNSNRTDFNELVSDDVRFDAIDISVIVIHSVRTLYEMWKDVNMKYQKAMINFTKSGEQDHDFFGYCSGSLDVFYLRECLEVKHDLTSFVDGGLRGEDTFDSLKRVRTECNVKDIEQQPPMKKKKSDVSDAINALAAAITPPGPTVVERLMKLHILIKQVEDRIHELHALGETDELLDQSSKLYREKLAQLQLEFSNEE